MAPSASTNSSRGATNQSKISAQKYLTNCKSLYSCIYCRTHLANHDELVSRSFQGNHGRAYLFNSVVNITCGPAVQRELNTGSHAVADILCETCRKTLGWKYEKAYVETQKYKEGKYIIELAHVVRENRHLEFDRGEMFFADRNFNKDRYNQCQASSRSNLKPPSTSADGNQSKSFVSSSPILVADDYDDPELMFPLYDDLYRSYTSYPKNLSLSQHNRMRRSLYLDSTPYDWKYSTTSSSANNKDEPTIDIASSLGSSDLSPSSSSSAASTSSCPTSANSSPTENRQSSYHIATDNQQRSSTLKQSRKQDGSRHSSTGDDNVDDFQFEFEADELIEACGSKSIEIDHALGDNCDKLVPKIENKLDESLCEKKSSIGSCQSLRQRANQNDQENDIDAGTSDHSSVSGVVCPDLNDGDGGPTQSIDSEFGSEDEKFYDCNTDHVVSSPMIVFDSTTQTKNCTYNN